MSADADTVQAARAEIAKTDRGEGSEPWAVRALLAGIDAALARLETAEAQRDTLAEALREIRDLRLREDEDSERAVNDVRMTMREIACAALAEAGLT